MEKVVCSLWFVVCGLWFFSCGGEKKEIQKNENQLTDISSVKIKGDYLVLFVYLSPTDDKYGPWSSCL